MSVFDRFFHRRPASVDAQSLPDEGAAPELRGIAGWINVEPLTLRSLRGRAVLVHFWTYSCVNCVRTMPAVQRWHEKYGSSGFTVIGVHTPEFDFERTFENVRAAVERFGITYPVALDTDYATWNAYKNRYWPADYFIDADGHVRYHHFGEGGYEDAEEVIRALLSEAGHAHGPSGEKVPPLPAEVIHIGTPETYLGFERSEYLGSPESVRKDQPRRYSVAKEPSSHIYYLDGLWNIHDDYAVPEEAGAAIVYKVNASAGHLVMEGPPGGKARVSVTLDGRPPAGSPQIIEVGEGRMYDLFDTHSAPGTHLLRLEFLDPGVKCHAFAFG